MAYNGIVSEAIERKAEILERVASGERITDIAQQLGYANHAGVANRLRSDPDYAQAIINGAWAKLEARESQLERAEDNVSVSRSRELMSQARWYAERIDRDRFSPKPDISININNIVHVDQALAGAAADLLNQLRTVSETTHAALQSPESTISCDETVK